MRNYFSLSRFCHHWYDRKRQRYSAFCSQIHSPFSSPEQEPVPEPEPEPEKFNSSKWNEFNFCSNKYQYNLCPHRFSQAQGFISSPVLIRNFAAANSLCRVIPVSNFFALNSSSHQFSLARGEYFFVLFNLELVVVYSNFGLCVQDFSLELKKLRRLKWSIMGNLYFLFAFVCLCDMFWYIITSFASCEMNYIPFLNFHDTPFKKDSFMLLIKWLRV